MKGGGKGFKGRAPVRDPWLVTRISREFCGRNRGSGGRVAGAEGKGNTSEHKS